MQKPLKLNLAAKENIKLRVGYILETGAFFNTILTVLKLKVNFKIQRSSELHWGCPYCYLRFGVTRIAEFEENTTVVSP